MNKETRIRQAVARGYGHPKNTHKVLDPDLLEAITEEIKKEFFEDDIKEKKIKKEIESIININSLENGSDTPDFILAELVVDCISVFEKAINRREEWYGRKSEEGVENIEIIE